MSKSNDKLISECSELRQDNHEQRLRIEELGNELESTNAALAQANERIAELEAEISRKERVINHYAVQLKQARKRLATERTPSDRREAMNAAKAEAMATGRLVRVA